MNRKTKKIEKDVAVKKAYQSYYSMMTKSGKQPMTQYHWKKGGRRQGYLGAQGSTTALAKLTRKERKSVGMKD